MYECLWGRELLMENICVVSKTEWGLVRVCLLCPSVCSPPALVIVLLGVSGVLWFLLLLLSSNLARVFVSRVAPFAVWSEAARVVTNGFEGTQAHILAWRPFLGWTWGEERVSNTDSGRSVLRHIQMVYQSLLLLLAKHKPEEQRPEAKACCLGLPFHL